ncbi:hypothetical protein EVJ58_g2590 [Rhodofomes roseus]|uniref:Uncharacterized protein n=1 Tax=Rhodofomes roseus TaxID=34475 RepID=A0A4Y9YRW1_9APHY|nr:hypothetical protein EVJ58_g2590 [Rhodofomes roseus]
MPDDIPTVFQYGLICAGTEPVANLFEIYVSVIRDLAVPARKIHQWRVSGRLHGELVKQLEQHPGERQQYLRAWLEKAPWTLEGLDGPIVASRELTQEVLQPAIRYAGLPEWYTADHIKNAGMAGVWHCCFDLRVTVHSPVLHIPKTQFPWIFFGFCTCFDEDAERRLRDLYVELMYRCTFDELYTATKTASLISLFDTHGLGAGMRSFPNLEDILRGSPWRFRIVYLLKQYVLCENATLHDFLAKTFGFAYCRGGDESADLKALYRRLFIEKRIDPLVLHRAAAKGRLYEMADASCGFAGAEKAIFRRLLKEGCPSSVPEGKLYGSYDENKDPAA